ncbi:hypothetical protein CFOL_v3_35492 [Cephalotus follicularis]|uniref:Uncharacterized protein n=1 Tax=Cephalotus follicularis TaxID=3775 RepID=A0A1Q3DHX7_CEPFO|nr:hypothetical protein CFOL_v3_35492 [Cephalotus follicularis]
MYVYRSMRRFCTAIRRRIEDEGDWSYYTEWWGTEQDKGHQVLRSTSNRGNGVVSVVAHPSSKPDVVYWAETERWLERRCGEVQPVNKQTQRFKVLGYEWRVLHFNDVTRQSIVKVMATCMESKPSSLCLMQQPHCLATPYLKSMVSVGLPTVVSCGYDLVSAVHGKRTMNILCIGHGGGSLPLFLASKIQGAVVHIVEIDPVVISASIQAMGFPGFSVMTPSGERAVSKPDTIDEVMWKGIHERLSLYESDAEKFVLENNNLYDMVFIDAYDGDDIFHQKLWDSNSPFLKGLNDRLHPEHGTVVVNLHSDAELLNPNESVSYFHQQLLPMGMYISAISQAYKDVLIGNGSSYDGKTSSGLGFNVSVPWICNTSLVVCRGFQTSSEYIDRDLVMNTLISKTLELEHVLKLPFSCLPYIQRGLTLVH